MKSTPESILESNKMEDVLTEIMSSLTVTEESDSSPKTESLEVTFCFTPIHKNPKKRGKASSHRLLLETDSVEACDGLSCSIANLSEDDDMVNKRPKLSSYGSESLILVTTSLILNDQESDSNQDASNDSEGPSDLEGPNEQEVFSGQEVSIGQNAFDGQDDSDEELKNVEYSSGSGVDIESMGCQSKDSL
ncbi:hypothetical protein K501DRAFT_266906 [Backusella circina FSU 941]|nr:hypothetical protein K501DRAFT_266906 [Backusella circina FSU 941]